MKRLFYNLLFLILAFGAIQIAACKKDEGFRHNAAAPVIIDSFIPAKGGVGTEVLVYGSNFSDNKAEITATLNGVACEVVGVDQGHFILKVPSKAGTGPIAITIGSQTAASDSLFNYIYTKKVSTFAGNGQQGYQDKVSGTDAGFYFYDRTGMTIDTTGNLYIADCGNHIIRKIDTTGFVTTFAGHINGEGYADGPPATAMFNLPTDIDIDKDGNLYVADKWNWFVRKITPDGTAYSFAAIADPTGIGVDKKTGNVYVTNASGGKVDQITPDGTITELPVSFNYPSDVAVDASGALLVVDQGSATIEKLVLASGAWTKTTIAGIPGTTGYTNGLLGVGTFNNPVGITIDKSGNIYIADYFNNSVRILDSKGNLSTFIGTNGGYSDGDGSTAQFANPSSVVFDKSGNMYVLDRGNGYIRKVTIQ